MKVILIDALPKLGKIGDVVVVKNGYAKNFLIPNKKAICFTEENYKSFESKKHEFEQGSIARLEGASKIKALTEGKNIIIIENASDDGRLYGSVNSSLIASKINELIGEKLVEKSAIFLNKPIKETGIYEVKLALHSELSVSVKLVVSRTESEAQALLNPKKPAKAKEESEPSLEENSDAESAPKKPRKKKEKASE
jgi:large subunit ribosomal protein L9